MVTSAIATRAPDQLGLALRRMRKNANMTQAELAKKAGVQQRTISKIERGQLNTELSTVFTICSALGLELLVQKKSKKTSKVTLPWVDK